MPAPLVDGPGVRGNTAEVEGLAIVKGAREPLAAGELCNKADGCRDITCEMVGICVDEDVPSPDVSISPSSLLLESNCSTI